MNLKLIMAASGASAVVLFFAQMFAGPQANVEVSKETTYISAPLAEDGLPNYALALIKEHRRGVTPENNAARLYWQAMRPTSLDAHQFALLSQELELGVASNRLAVATSNENANRMADWIAVQLDAASVKLDQLAGPLVDPLDAAHEYLTAAAQTPWRADEFPTLAQ